jgi:competence protein ComGC
LYKRLHNEYGFLLADGVIAILIISIALAACMGIVVKSHQAARVSAGYTAAVYLAQKQAEILKGTKKPSDWKAMCNSNSFLNTSETQNLNGITYTITAKAAVCEETKTNKALVEVTINVSWNENDGKHSYQILTAYPAVDITKSI